MSDNKRRLTKDEESEIILQWLTNHPSESDLPTTVKVKTRGITMAQADAIAKALAILVWNGCDIEVIHAD